MKLLNVICAIFLAVSVIVFMLYNFYLFKITDKEGPVITIDKDLIEVSVNDNRLEWLRGVSASDIKDGDVSKSLGVESISSFNENMERTVHYIAFDSNNNVARAERKLRYTDYEPAVFSLDEPLRFPASLGNTDVLGSVHAWDCLDGDISNQISFSENSIIYPSVPSDYNITLVVKNSAGKSEKMPVTVTIYDPQEESACPSIILKNYLIYIKKGQIIDPFDYIEGIEFNRKEYLFTDGRGTYDIDTSEMTNEERVQFSKEEPAVGRDKFRISSEIDSNTPGTYEVKYSIDSPEGHSGSVNLVVVVSGDD